MIANAFLWFCIEFFDYGLLLYLNQATLYPWNLNLNVS